MAGKDHSALLRQLGEQAETLRSSDGWQQWLQTARKFRKYSVSNQFLIMSQRPSATRVAGFKTWQSIGRHVRRGEKGIAILAPNFHKSENDDGDTFLLLSGFHVVHIFDIAQTDGADLAELEMPEVLISDESLYERLLAVARGAEITVVHVDSHGDSARGWWEPSERSISIVNSYPLASRTRTLLHELAHAHDAECDGFNGTNRDEREMLAESVAFLVGSSLGIDLDNASTFYVTSWGADTERLQEIAGQVLQVANNLEQAIEAVAVLAVAA